MHGSLQLQSFIIVKFALKKRSIVMSTYALCGFANIGAIGIMIGSLSGMVPERRSEIAYLAPRAMIVGNVVSFMNACTAGQ
jgi:nucleoside permease NupC